MLWGRWLVIGYCVFAGQSPPKQFNGEDTQANNTEYHPPDQAGFRITRTPEHVRCSKEQQEENQPQPKLRPFAAG
jgi:hypothetical protein